MSHLRLSIIHQWWLEPDELSSILFQGKAEHISTVLYPLFTDCSESIFLADASDCLLNKLDSNSTDHIEERILKCDLKSIDPRLVAIVSAEVVQE